MNNGHDYNSRGKEYNHMKHYLIPAGRSIADVGLNLTRQRACRAPARKLHKRDKSMMYKTSKSKNTIYYAQLFHAKLKLTFLKFFYEVYKNKTKV